MPFWGISSFGRWHETPLLQALLKTVSAEKDRD